MIAEITKDRKWLASVMRNPHIALFFTMLDYSGFVGTLECEEAARLCAEESEEIQTEAFLLTLGTDTARMHKVMCQSNDVTLAAYTVALLLLMLNCARGGDYEKSARSLVVLRECALLKSHSPNGTYTKDELREMVSF